MPQGMIVRGLSVDDVLTNQPCHDSRASIGRCEPTPSFGPIAMVVVDYFPLNTSGTAARFVCVGINEQLRPSYLLTRIVEHSEFRGYSFTVESKARVQIFFFKQKTAY